MSALPHSATYIVRIQTSDTKNADTDDPVQIKLHGSSGLVSNWLALDNDGVDDFEGGID